MFRFAKLSSSLTRSSSVELYFPRKSPSHHKSDLIRQAVPNSILLGGTLYPGHGRKQVGPVLPRPPSRGGAGRRPPPPPPWRAQPTLVGGTGRHPAVYVSCLYPTSIRTSHLRPLCPEPLTAVWPLTVSGRRGRRRCGYAAVWCAVVRRGCVRPRPKCVADAASDDISHGNPTLQAPGRPSTVVCRGGGRRRDSAVSKL